MCHEDKSWFEKAISRVIQEHVDPGLVAELHPDPYFVDFLREAPEPTGEENEDSNFDAPKIYELVNTSCSQTCKLPLCVYPLIQHHNPPVSSPLTSSHRSPALTS